MRTKQCMRPLLLFLLEHVALFHAVPPGVRQRRLLHNGEERKPCGYPHQSVPFTVAELLHMVGRKKKKKFSAMKAVKSLARETIGSPPPVQRIPTLKESHKEKKHKPTLGKLLVEE